MIALSLEVDTFQKNFGQRHQKSENLKSRNESIVNSNAVCATSTKGSLSVDVFCTGAARGLVLLVASKMASCTTHSHTAKFPHYEYYFWAQTEQMHNRCAQTTLLHCNWPLANWKRNACTHFAPAPLSTQTHARMARCIKSNDPCCVDAHFEWKTHKKIARLRRASLLINKVLKNLLIFTW